MTPRTSSLLGPAILRRTSVSNWIGRWALIGSADTGGFFGPRHPRDIRPAFAGHHYLIDCVKQAPLDLVEAR